MKTTWLITMKPTFQTEWLALQPKESHQILEKLTLLTQDPTPDAKVKKQLKYLNGKLHRLRSGHYRIFYTFEQPYISLLALRRREDDTYDEDFDAEFLGGLDPELKVELQSQQPNWEKIFAPKEPEKTPLPEPITAALLENLRVPLECHERLVRVQTREDLLACPGIPDEILLKLDEYLARERRTMFVAFTRAMRALLVIVPNGTSSPLLKNFDPTKWNLGESK